MRKEYDRSDEEFDRLLTGLVAELSAQTILGIAGVYEVLSEHFNNAVLDAWAEEQSDD